MEASEEKILQDSREYAENKGFQLNQDERILTAVIHGLAINKKEKGKPYCPCRAFTGNPEEDDKNVCPCVFHTAEIAEDGHCKCLLFLKK